MTNDVDKLKVLFHDRAQRTLFSVYKSYISTLSSVNRQGNENFYQQYSSRYCQELKYKFQIIIKEIINKTNSDPNELNAILNHLATEYEREFMQKIKSL